MAENEVRIKIKIDSNTQELIVTKNEFEKLGTTVKVAETYTDRFNKRIAEMAHFSATIYSIKKGFDAILNPLKEIVTVSAEFERQKSILKTLEGDSVKAQKSFEWVKTFASDTPYQINTVAEAFLKAKAYGIDPVNGTLKTLGDTASGMGKDINQAVEAMADAMVGENERLKEFGIRASVNGNKIAYDWMSSSGKAKHIIIQNNSEIVQSTLNSIFNSKYKGAMSEQMATYNGLVSNLKDQYTNFLDDVGRTSGVFDGVKIAIKDTATEFSNLTNNEEKMMQLGLVTKNSFLLVARAGQTVSMVVTGWLYIFETVDTIIDQVANNAVYAFLNMKRAWAETVYEFANSANAVLPDFMLEKFGVSDADVKELERNLLTANKVLLDQGVVLQNRLTEHYNYADGLNTVNDTISKTINSLDNYNIAIKDNTKVKEENKDKNFGNDGKSNIGSDSELKKATKAAEDLNKALLEIKQIGMSEYDKGIISISQKTNEWLKSGVSLNDALAAQSVLLDELNVKTQIATAKEDLSYYERKVQLQNDSLEKEIELANISYTQKTLDISGNTSIEAERKKELISLEDELYVKTVERLKAEDNIKDIDSALERQTTMLDTQISMIDATDAWGNSFDGVAKTIGNVSGAYTKMYKANLVSQKQQISLDAKLAKDKERYGADSIEYAESQNQYIMDSSKLKQDSQNAEIAGYANLAGAMSSVFKEGSTGAKAFQTIQATLGIVNGYTAITTAWASAPFPANLPAVAAATAGVLPIIATLTSMGGSGGSGGGSSSPYSLGEMSVAKTIELQDQTVVDRLDQQIALLEAIERNGSAQKLSVDLAKAEFTQAKNEWVQDVFDMSKLGNLKTNFDSLENKYGSTPNYYVDLVNKHYKDLGTINPYIFADDGKTFKINTKLLRENTDDFIKIMGDMSKITKGEGFDWIGSFGQKIAEELGYSSLEANEAFLAQVQATFTEMQGYVNDWAISVVDSVSELKDNAEDFKDLYDDLTGISYYADIKLKKAFDDFNSLLAPGENYADYLKNTIDKIDVSSKFIYELSGILDENGKELSNYELLLSKNTDLIDEQIAKVDEFGSRVGLVFEDGIEQAINYADSIELVSQALVTSRANEKTYLDSFKSDLTLANELAKNIGLNSLATDLESLDSLFVYLKSDTLGLVDAELELLNANKSLIENYNDVISQIDNIISPKTLSLGAVKVEDVTLESATDFLDQLSAAKDAEINRATTAMNAEKERLQKQKETAQAEKQAADTLKKAFENTTKSLKDTYKNIIGQTSLADSFNITQYEKLYKEIDAGITAGTDISSLTSDFNSYATSYAAYIKDNATTQQEYDRKMKTLANEVKGLAGRSETASLNDLDNKLNDANNNLTSIDSSISSLDTNLQNKIDSINATYITQTQLLKNALEYSFKNNVSNTQTNTKVIDYSILVEDAYKTVLGRASDVEGKNYWLEQLNTGKITEQDLYKTIANAAVEFDINGYLASTGDYSLKTLTMLSDSVKNAQKYLSDNISQTTTTQTTNYYTQSSSDKALDEVVKELQRLNIISAANAENTKKLLKTNKQTLITGLQGA